MARLSQSIQKSLQTGKDLMFLLDADKNTVTQYSKQLMCADTGLSYEEPSPNTFSFNSPYGACPKCKGLGSVYQVNMNEVIPVSYTHLDVYKRQLTRYGASKAGHWTGIGLI